MSVRMRPLSQGHETYNCVQALRFVAAFMVVVTHSWFYASERLDGVHWFWGDGAKGVDLFFVISGFVMYVSGSRLAEVPGGALLFMQRRLIRIVPLYWLFTTLKLITMLATAGLVRHAKFDAIAVLCSYFFLPSYNVDGLIEPLLGVGWTLNYEMLFYVIFAIALAFHRNLVVNVLAVLALLAAGSLGRPFSAAAAQFYLNPIVLEFGFGILIALLVRRGTRAPFGLAVGLLIVGLCLLVTPFGDSLPKVAQGGIPAAIVVYAAVSLEQEFGRRIPWPILFFGAASYSLYLSHPLIAPLAPTLLNKIGLYSPIVSVVCSVAVALVVSSLVYKGIEQPLLAALNRRFSQGATRGGNTPRKDKPRQPEVPPTGIA